MVKQPNNLFYFDEVENEVCDVRLHSSVARYLSVACVASIAERSSFVSINRHDAQLIERLPKR